MDRDAARGHARPAPPATGGATGALLLLLGGLALFLIGCHLVFPIEPRECLPGEVVVDGACQKRNANHYACECQCTKGFSVGARVVTAQQIAIRDAPGGQQIGQAPAGTEGTLVAGPVQADLGNVTETWWQVDFDTDTDGWVIQQQLTPNDPDPLLVKPLDVCLPPELNANLEGGHVPTPAEVEADCSVRVAGQFAAVTGQELPAGSTCTCTATSAPTLWDAGCDAGCADPTGVCLLAGSDPPQPTPDPLSTSLFATSTVCEVPGGEAEIHVDDRVVRTAARGFVQIHGRPCLPGQTCRVGLSYQLTFDEVTIPVRFASDPTFVDLALSGASQPMALDLGPFPPFDTLHVGSLPSDATLNSGRGRRSSSPNHVVAVGGNAGPLDVAVDWVNKRCLIDGDFLAQVEDDDGNIASIRFVITAGGLDETLSRIVNQPPRASAGPDQTVECTAPETPVTLSAAGSTDADGNIAFHVWRRGSETGPHVGTPSTTPAVTTRQALGETTYVVRVVDGRLAADTDSVKVSVVDTSPPAIECHAPATIDKHDAPFAFTATAGDTCGAASAPLIESFQCFKVRPDGDIKSNPSCQVAIQGDTIRIDKAAGGDLIRWSARATDGTGNVGQRTCEVRVVR
jgi:hypothetical protein